MFTKLQLPLPSCTAHLANQEEEQKRRRKKEEEKMSKSRLPLYLGLGVAGVGGYYLYQSGGDVDRAKLNAKGTFYLQPISLRSFFIDLP